MTSEERLGIIPATGVGAGKSSFKGFLLVVNGGHSVFVAEPRPVPVTGPTLPWRHQAKAYWFCRERSAALLHMGLGTGKTRVVVDLVCSMPEIRRTLVLCPKSVIGVWPRMFATHGSEDVRVLAPDGGTTLRKAEKLERDWDAPGKSVVVLNYDSARQGFGGKGSKGMARWILSKEWDLVVADESHKLKSAWGKTSRFAWALRSRAARRLCLTGTPMPHSPVDIFGQFRFLEPRIFGDSWPVFRARYVITATNVPAELAGKIVIGYKNQDEMARKMDAITFTAKTEDVLDLPPYNDVDREFDLSKEEARAYKEMEEEFVTEIRGGKVTAANVLVRLLRLAQITSGAIATDDEVERILGQSKRSLLLEVLEDCGPDEPVAVFCRFLRDLDQVHDVAKELGRKSMELSGRRNDLVETGSKWESGDILAVQEQAGGVGIDLTRCRYLVFWSLGYSLGNHEQARGRVWRPGQARPVTYIYLVARGTVDRAVREALEKKQEVVDHVLARLSPLEAKA